MNREQKISIRVICYLITVLVAFDQITKLIFSSRDFFIGPIHIHLIKNFGLGFGLNFGWLPNLSVIAIALIFFVYYYFSHRLEFFVLEKISFALIFAGALSNIMDRLYLGFVRDFLDLGLGFTFNFADVFVVIGLVIILFLKPKSNIIPL